MPEDFFLRSLYVLVIHLSKHAGWSTTPPLELMLYSALCPCYFSRNIQLCCFRCSLDKGTPQFQVSIFQMLSMKDGFTRLLSISGVLHLKRPLHHIASEADETWGSNPTILRIKQFLCWNRRGNVSKFFSNCTDWSWSKKNFFVNFPLLLGQRNPCSSGQL